MPGASSGVCVCIMIEGVPLGELHAFPYSYVTLFNDKDILRVCAYFDLKLSRIHNVEDTHAVMLLVSLSLQLTKQ